MAVPTVVSQWIIDVDESTWEQDVIERSRTVPVVVDFWAAWCGPCRMLGPVLEGFAQEYGGRFILARLDVDANQNLAIEYNVQGIPAVKGFRDGRVAAEFLGAQPKPAVRQFIDKLLPNAAESQITAAQKLLDAGNYVQAEQAYLKVLDENGDQPAALLGLARAQAAQGQADAALETLGQVPAGTPEAAQADRLRWQLDLRREVAGASEADLRARLAEDAGDAETRYRLAGLLTADERYEDALEQYLELVKRNRGFRNGAPRQAMLNIFELLGEQPLARTYRNKLASVLFA